jgi:hypothetical protein
MPKKPTQAEKAEASKLAAFLLGLQESKSALDRFNKKKRQEMKRFDLSADTIEAVINRNQARIWTILSAGHAPQVCAAAMAPKRLLRRKRKRN